MRYPLVIAEIGNNHEGSLAYALDAISEAKEAGADLIKFQAGDAEGFAREKEQIPLYKKFELKEIGYDVLLKRAEQLKIPLFFSIWNNMYDKYWNLKYRKIPARQCTLENIKKHDSENTFISIPQRCFDLFIDTTKKVELKGIPLFVIEEYPAFNIDLKYIGYLKKIVNKDVGYSDHSIGFTTCVRAVREQNAIVIEKHFTLMNKNNGFRDHIHSLNPTDFKKMVTYIK